MISWKVDGGPGGKRYHFAGRVIRISNKTDGLGAREWILVCLVVEGALAIGGCGKGDSSASDAAKCTFIAPPSACPTDAPSFNDGSADAASINSVIQANCAVPQCHAPTGVESIVPLQTYADIEAAVHATSYSFTSYISNCRMPPAGNPQLSLSERTALLTWISCGAPDN